MSRRMLTALLLLVACREPLGFPSEPDSGSGAASDADGALSDGFGDDLDAARRAQLEAAGFDLADFEFPGWDGGAFDPFSVDSALSLDGEWSTWDGLGSFDAWDPFDPDDLLQFGPDALTILPPEVRYNDDPNGTERSGPPSPACAEGVEVSEVCGNGIDDDCDVIVDEEPLLGTDCPVECSEDVGRYACDIVTNEVVCLDTDNRRCRGARFIGCGNGMRDQDEECDYAAPDQVLGETCTLDCMANPFPRCVFNDTWVPKEYCPPQGDSDACVTFYVIEPEVRPEECTAPSTRCVEHIGACMPSLSTGLRRCPDIPRETPPFCGNGIVDPGEDCELGFIDLTAGLICAWNCRLAPLDFKDDPRVAPPWPMLEYEDGRDGPVDCVVTCSSDAACPTSLPKCYMGRCVALLEEEGEQE